MAKKDDQTSKKKELSKASSRPSMRELTNRDSQPKKPGRVRNLTNKVRKSGGKDSGDKAKKIRVRRFHIFPGFLRNAWAEIRQVTWPTRRETIRLSFAVFIFAAVFATIISALDFGLDKVFRELIIKV